jgi:hypothetical protein
MTLNLPDFQLLQCKNHVWRLGRLACCGGIAISPLNGGESVVIRPFRKKG